MVGCVLVRDGTVVGEGWHRKFGDGHAEVEALRAAGPLAQGATAFVTLEPCHHHGKTPPCTTALIAAGVRRVVCAQRDPFPEVSGRGFAALESAGVLVEVGFLEDQARQLNAPYLKLVTTGRPWLIAKWAMSLDGKIATRSGDSRWISSEASRKIVHTLRGRVDGIMVGRGTVELDDPLLTARPPGPRVATRIVVDSLAAIASDRRLVQTARTAPVLIAAGAQAAQENMDRLAAAGCEVIICRHLGIDPTESPPPNHRLVPIGALLDELGRRRLTNVLVEGGSKLLGSLFDAGAVDEVHLFIAPRIIGGHGAAAPIAGRGVDSIATALQLRDVRVQHVDRDLYVSGVIAH